MRALWIPLAIATTACGVPGRRPPEFLWGPARDNPPPLDDNRPRVGGTPGSAANYASAAATLPAAIGATAIQRTTNQTCWAACQPGSECDAASGLCVALPCGGKCTADQICREVEGKPACVRGTPDRVQPDP